MLTQRYPLPQLPRKHASRKGHGVSQANVGKDIQWAVEADLADIEPALYDLRSDPEELHNIALDPNYRPVLDALRTKLQNIVLGDGRVEVAWSRKGESPARESHFADGAHDGKIELPELVLQK